VKQPRSRLAPGGAPSAARRSAGPRGGASSHAREHPLSRGQRFESTQWASSQLLQNTPLHPVAEWGRQRFSTDEPADRHIADLENTLRLVGCHSAWSPKAGRRGDSLNCLRKEESNSDPNSHKTSRLLGDVRSGR
jgi:hypothetical protein